MIPSLRRRFDQFRVEWWWFWERHLGLLDGLDPYWRRHRAERDLVHRYGINVYGQRFVCSGCGDRRYHSR